MKVLELVLKWEGGGVERYVEDLCCAARDMGVDCKVASVTSAVSSHRVQGYGPLVDGGVRGALLRSGTIESFVKEGEYDIVHIHGNNGLSFRFAHLARRAGAKVIIHSHNSAFGRGSTAAKGLFTDIQRRRYVADCNGMLACSRAAGEFLFAGNEYRVVLNGINVERFSYDLSTREELRESYGVPYRVPLIGFAASFVDVKNPLFALEVFKAASMRIPDARFLLCGDGELFEGFKAAASDLIADERCACVGRVADIERYYSAMDVLLAPSKYEGLPINLIEAQANGLPVVMSDAITDEVVVIPRLCSRLPLDAGVNTWADEVVAALAPADSRSAVAGAAVKAAGYSQPECFEPVLDMYRRI